MRNPSLSDSLLNEVDTALRAIFPPKNRHSNRPSPAAKAEDASLKKSQKLHIAGLMRVNHSGEVCAQALYQGQALTARLPETRHKMALAAQEEIDHLAWCETRLQELNAKPSLMNPFWYSGSFLIGALAGLAGDKYSLGFVAETERQVSAHLQNHMKQLPEQDQKTRLILEQMNEDETQHAETAIQAGAADLPLPVKKIMGLVSKLMTKTSYHF